MSVKTKLVDLSEEKKDVLLAAVKAIAQEDEYNIPDYVEVYETEKEIVLTAGRMYEHLSVGSRSLFALCDLFGTQDINTDSDSSPGCDTCDYGSDYKHTFHILQPSKHIGVFSRNNLYVKGPFPTKGASHEE